MTGSGPAGELTMADIKSRLAAVVDHIVREEQSHEQRATDIASERTAGASPVDDQTTA